MADQIDISGLDRAAVLAALFNASRPQGLGFLHYEARTMSIEEARVWLTRQTYFDYLEGRVMKVNLSGDSFDPWLYDRDNGPNAAARVIDSLRAEGNTNSSEIQSLHESGRAEGAFRLMKTLAEEDAAEEVETEPGVYRLGISEFSDQLLRRLHRFMHPHG